jgi:thioredoxin-related protein
MKRLLILVSVLLLCTCLFANVVAQRSSDKVLGHGDVAGFGENKDESANESRLATEDSSKWFITLLIADGCPHCERLRRDFAQHPQLKAIVDTGARQKSWAHWNVCAMEDSVQSRRFKATHSSVKIQGYPTLLVQPPRNGQYGNSQAIVLQKTGYDGDAPKLARQLSSSIERHKARVSKSANGARESLDSIARPSSAVTR